LSKQQVLEMLEVDVRDLQIPLKKILQGEPSRAFKEQESRGLVVGQKAEEIMKGGEAND
jgi:hypothetical protein